MESNDGQNGSVLSFAASSHAPSPSPSPLSLGLSSAYTTSGNPNDDHPDMRKGRPAAVKEETSLRPEDKTTSLLPTTSCSTNFLPDIPSHDALAFRPELITAGQDLPSPDSSSLPTTIHSLFAAGQRTASSSVVDGYSSLRTAPSSLCPLAFATHSSKEEFLADSRQGEAEGTMPARVPTSSTVTQSSSSVDSSSSRLSSSCGVSSTAPSSPKEEEDEEEEGEEGCCGPSESHTREDGENALVPLYAGARERPQPESPRKGEESFSSLSSSASPSSSSPPSLPAFLPSNVSSAQARQVSGRPQAQEEEEEEQTADRLPRGLPPSGAAAPSRSSSSHLGEPLPVAKARVTSPCSLDEASSSSSSPVASDGTNCPRGEEDGRGSKTNQSLSNSSSADHDTRSSTSPPLPRQVTGKSSREKELSREEENLSSSEVNVSSKLAQSRDSPSPSPVRSETGEHPRLAAPGHEIDSPLEDVEKSAACSPPLLSSSQDTPENSNVPQVVSLSENTSASSLPTESSPSRLSTAAAPPPPPPPGPSSSSSSPSSFLATPSGLSSSHLVGGADLSSPRNVEVLHSPSSAAERIAGKKKTEAKPEQEEEIKRGEQKREEELKKEEEEKSVGGDGLLSSSSVSRPLPPSQSRPSSEDHSVGLSASPSFSSSVSDEEAAKKLTTVTIDTPQEAEEAYQKRHPGKEEEGGQDRVGEADMRKDEEEEESKEGRGEGEREEEEGNMELSVVRQQKYPGGRVDAKLRLKFKREFARTWVDINRAPSWPPIKKNKYLSSDWQRIDLSSAGGEIRVETKKHRIFLNDLCYLFDGVFTQKSTLGRRAGLGLFCERAEGLHKGQIITEFVGWLVDRDLAESYRKQRTASHIVAVQKGFLYIDGAKDPAYGMGGGSFANDGSEFLGGPGNNSQFHHWFDDELGRTRVFLRATADIKCGEEIFVPYDKTYWLDNLEEQAENCPEAFRQKKLEQLRKKYKDPNFVHVPYREELAIKRAAEEEAEKKKKRFLRDFNRRRRGGAGGGGGGGRQTGKSLLLASTSLGRRELNNEDARRRIRKKKKSSVKRPLTAYLLYSIQRRRELYAELASSSSSSSSSPPSASVASGLDGGAERRREKIEDVQKKEELLGEPSSSMKKKKNSESQDGSPPLPASSSSSSLSQESRTKREERRRARSCIISESLEESKKDGRRQREKEESLEPRNERRTTARGEEAGSEQRGSLSEKDEKSREGKKKESRGETDTATPTTRKRQSSTPLKRSRRRDRRPELCEEEEDEDDGARKKRKKNEEGHREEDKEEDEDAKDAQPHASEGELKGAEDVDGEGSKKKKEEKKKEETEKREEDLSAVALGGMKLRQRRRKRGGEEEEEEAAKEEVGETRTEQRRRRQRRNEEKEKEEEEQDQQTGGEEKEEVRREKKETKTQRGRQDREEEEEEEKKKKKASEAMGDQSLRQGEEEERERKSHLCSMSIRQIYADLTKQIAEEWKNLPRQEKDPWIKLAEDDRKRYFKEKTAMQTRRAPPHRQRTKPKKTCPGSSSSSLKTLSQHDEQDVSSQTGGGNRCSGSWYRRRASQAVEGQEREEEGTSEGKDCVGETEMSNVPIKVGREEEEEEEQEEEKKKKDVEQEEGEMQNEEDKEWKTKGEKANDGRDEIPSEEESQKSVHGSGEKNETTTRPRRTKASFPSSSAEGKRQKGKEEEEEIGAKHPVGGCVRRDEEASLASFSSLPLSGHPTRADRRGGEEEAKKKEQTTGERKLSRKERSPMKTRGKKRETLGRDPAALEEEEKKEEELEKQTMGRRRRGKKDTEKLTSTLG